MSELPWKSEISLRSWSDRSNTIGYISGGMAVQAFLLKQVIDLLPAPGEAVLHFKAPNGKEIAMQCEKLAVHQLSTAKFAVKGKGGSWAPSAESLKWKESEDDKYLASHIHSNVKFFGEALEAIDSNTSHADLLRIAREIYGLPWNSSDQVRRRIGWLRSLGFVELWGQRIVRTSEGDSLLGGLELCSPEVARGEVGPQEIGDYSHVGSIDFPDITQEELRKRKATIGYIPRGKKAIGEATEESVLSPIQAMREIARLVRENPNKEDFKEASKEALGISQASFNSMLHAARGMGLLEQVAMNKYAVSVGISELLNPGREVDLVGYLHSNYSFFGEILKYLDNPKATSALVEIAEERYGVKQLTNSEVRLRLGILENAGLVFRLDWQRFSRNSSGKNFADRVTLQRELGLDNKSSVTDDSENIEDLNRDTFSGVPDIEKGLRKFGTSGTDSLAFEKTVAAAFSVLGFKVEHIGGSGNTDVVAVAELAPADRYKVIIDAKSSGSGVISESHVKFDALKDHKKKNGADFIVVVGPGFAARVKEWAVDHGVALFLVDDLIDIIRMHSLSPLGLMDFKDVLGRSELHVEEMRERYQIFSHRSLLTSKVMDLSFQEANDEDPLSGGMISEENISYVLRKEMDPRPSSDDVREVLEFLCSPMVGALEENKGKYKIVDSLHNVMIRLRGLGAAVGSS